MMEGTEIFLIHKPIFYDKLTPKWSGELLDNATVRKSHTGNVLVVICKKFCCAVLKLKESLVFGATVESLHCFADNRYQFTGKGIGDVDQSFNAHTVKHVVHYFSWMKVLQFLNRGRNV